MLDPSAIYAGVRRLVVWLCAIGHDVADADDGMTPDWTDPTWAPVPVVEIRSTPNLVHDRARRLRTDLMLAGIEISPGVITAFYDPTDNRALILLAGLDDSDLGPPKPGTPQLAEDAISSHGSAAVPHCAAAPTVECAGESIESGVPRATGMGTDLCSGRPAWRRSSGSGASHRDLFASVTPDEFDSLPRPSADDIKRALRAGHTGLG